MGFSELRRNLATHPPPPKCRSLHPPALYEFLTNNIEFFMLQDWLTLYGSNIDGLILHTNLFHNTYRLAKSIVTAEDYGLSLSSCVTYWNAKGSNSKKGSPLLWTILFHHENAEHTHTHTHTHTPLLSMLNSQPKTSLWQRRGTLERFSTTLEHYVLNLLRLHQKNVRPNERLRRYKARVRTLSLNIVQYM